MKKYLPKFYCSFLNRRNKNLHITCLHHYLFRHYLGKTIIIKCLGYLIFTTTNKTGLLNIYLDSKLLLLTRLEINLSISFTVIYINRYQKLQNFILNINTKR